MYWFVVPCILFMTTDFVIYCSIFFMISGFTGGGNCSAKFKFSLDSEESRCENCWFYACNLWSKLYTFWLYSRSTVRLGHINCSWFVSSLLEHSGCCICRLIKYFIPHFFPSRSKHVCISSISYITLRLLPRLLHTALTIVIPNWEVRCVL